jgi:conjugative relaxase-like TrwC/TraI family protein
MMRLSKALAPEQLMTYHHEQFSSGNESYYARGGEVGQWRGALAAELGLAGAVTAEQLRHLANGQSPTGEQLIRRVAQGNRAGWDATFSAPKSVSATALIGGDKRVLRAHEESVDVALGVVERFVQARMGGKRAAEVSGKMVAGLFRHDIARPVDGYSAPQLHTHAVILNLTKTSEGKWRALQERDTYRVQQLASAVYQSELAWRLKAMGYELERGANHAPEIKGYTKEYMDALSPRRKKMEAYVEERGASGAGAFEVAALATREAKQALSPEETLARHREVSQAHGNQEERIIRGALERGEQQEIPAGARWKQAEMALTWSSERNLERQAVVRERDVMRDALRRSMGQAKFADVAKAFEERIGSGEFIDVKAWRCVVADRFLTTMDMQQLEESNIRIMDAGKGTAQPLAGPEQIEKLSRERTLSPAQIEAAKSIVACRDRVQALEGVAGSGKTWGCLSLVRDAAAQAGFSVQGLAPTGTASNQLGEAGIPGSTLQRFLGRTREDIQEKTFFVVDESSLVSTRMAHEFLVRLGPEDRVLFVGGIRQHQAVEAGIPFQQLQEAGMHTASLDEVVRQKDPELRHVVELLARGNTVEALGNLVRQGRVHEVSNRQERMQAIAKDFAAQPDKTLVVSADNESRRALNAAIRQELRGRGSIEKAERKVTVLVAEQELTGADRQWAGGYKTGDVLRYSKASRVHGVRAGEYARVAKVDVDHNALIVERSNGERLMYDPRRLRGVSVYREEERSFSVGDRIQFTAPFAEERVTNRQLGTVQRIDRDGNVQLRMDSGRDVQFNVREMPHLDHGFASTSHAAQGTTVERVILDVDSAMAREELVNSRLAYVGLSRGASGMELYTNDGAALVRNLSRQVSKSQALPQAPSLAKGSEMRVGA